MSGVSDRGAMAGRFPVPQVRPSEIVAGAGRAASVRRVRAPVAGSCSSAWCSRPSPVDPAPYDSLVKCARVDPQR